MEQVNWCQENNGMISSLSVVDGVGELILGILMMVLMVLLLAFIIKQLITKNFWGDLTGIEKRLIQALIVLCLVSGVLYLIVGSVQICLYKYIWDQKNNSKLFIILYKIYFKITIIIGLCVSNIVLIVSYTLGHLNSSYFQKPRKNKLRVIFGLALILNNIPIIVGLCLQDLKVENGSTLVWWANILSTILTASIMIFVSVRFTRNIKFIGNEDQNLKNIRLKIYLIVYGIFIRFCYAVYLIILVTSSQKNENLDVLNFLKVNNNCRRMYKWGIYMNIFINLSRFYIPILAVIKIFSSVKNNTKQPSLYESIYDRSRTNSEARSETQ